MTSTRRGRRIVLHVAALASITAAGNAQSTTAASQECPDATDTPAMIGYYVGVAYRALSTDPARQLPPLCLLAAIVNAPAEYSDTTVTHALALADALVKRQPNDPGPLNARFMLISRLRRYGEIGPAFDRLVASDSLRATAEAYRIVIAAAKRNGDTASMVRYLTKAIARHPRAAQLSAEYDVLRQVPRLRALVDTVQRAMAADPRRTGGYASLASIYGTLGEVDSALIYIRKGLAARAPRPEIAASLTSLVGGLLRHAQIQNAIDVWETTLPIAFQVDSILSTPETKYLVAVSISSVVTQRINPLSFFLPPVQLGSGRGSFESIDVSRIPRSKLDEACPSIASVLELLSLANDRLASGGDRFAPETVPAILDAMRTIRGRVAPLQRGCGGGPPS